MEFINRIYYSLTFVRGAGSRKPRMLVVCALLGAAALTRFNSGLAQSGHATALQREAAVGRLKTDGGYASLAAARYQINAAHGQSGAPFYASNPGQRLRATFASEYPLTIDPILTQQKRLTADDGAANDEFGYSVAVSGDIAVIGAPVDNLIRKDQGSAYVFVRSGGGWTQQQKLVADDGAAGDAFGSSVSISGDTVVVGATGKSGDFRGQGAAYVFTRSGATWTQQQKLMADDAAAGDAFGGSVAISGDTVVVSAPLDVIGVTVDQGSAYVFTRSGTVWTQQQKLTAADGAAEDIFGFSVAISGDTLVAGAKFDNIAEHEDQGSAYVFTRSGGVWTQRQKLVAGDGAEGDLFGHSVAVSGDTIVVGAPTEDGALFGQGAAYVFARGGATWAQQQKLTADDAALGDRGDAFGVSVGISGDTLVVGAYLDNIGATFLQGSAYVFSRSGATWTQQQKLIADDGADNDTFGWSVAVSGGTVVVGAVLDDIGGTFNQGSAYVFVRAACPTIMLDPELLPGGVVGNLYSQTVTASGGAGPYQFSLSDGSLPPGLILAQNGQISGTPAAAGTYSFTITATILSSLCPGSRRYTLTIESPVCQFSVSPTNHAFSSQGGNGVVSVNASGSCAWTAAPDDPLITITSGSTGSGAATVRFAVSQNPNGGSRRGTLTIAGRKVTVVQAAPFANASAASFIGNTLATESIVAAFGSGLSQSTEAATTQPLPTTLAGTQVSVLDSLGTERFAPLFIVTPTQINFQVPPGTAAGKALVTIIRDGKTVAADSPQVEMVSPGLFSADASGQGLLVGFALRVKADGSRSFEPVARFDGEKRQFVAAPIDLDSATDNVFLILFGTGLRNRSSLDAVSVKIGGVTVDALYAGPQGEFVGLDQLNASLPRSLAGRGEVVVSVTVNGMAANNLKLAIK